MMGLLLEENNILFYCFSKANSFGLGLLLSSFFLLVFSLKKKHNASLTHIASFRLMTPRPVVLRALGVETPLRA